MADQSNVWRSRSFREAVTLTLQLAGVEGATPAPITRRPTAAEAFADGPLALPGPHIEGVPRWALMVHADSRSGARWGSHLDAAEQVANLTGAHHFGVIGYRKMRTTSEAFAILTLDQLAELILETQGVKS